MSDEISIAVENRLQSILGKEKGTEKFKKTKVEISEKYPMLAGSSKELIEAYADQIIAVNLLWKNKANPSEAIFTINETTKRIMEILEKAMSV